MARVLFLAGNTRSLIANRGDLVRAMREAGHEVHALVPAYISLRSGRRGTSNRG